MGSGVWASVVVAHRLQGAECCGTGLVAPAPGLSGMWGLSRPGIEPMSPALAGRFLITKAPGKPL